MVSILCIGDPHDKPDISQERFKWLGNFIVAHQPDVIMNMGDHCDAESLQGVRSGTKNLTPSRQELQKRELDSFKKSWELIFNPISKYNALKTRRKKASYKPQFIMVEGNHEYRYTKFYGRKTAEKMLYGDLLNHVEVVPFLEPKFINGVAFCHRFISDTGFATNDSVTTMLQTTNYSSVSGDTHKLDRAWRRRLDGHEIGGLFTGCYLDPDQEMEYVGPQGMNNWWSGLILLPQVSDGQFFTHEYPIDYIERNYS